MLPLRCKICGKELNINGEKPTTICAYCGIKQAVPVIKNEQILELYNQANEYRRKKEFDIAKTLYERILEFDPQNADVYWSLILCHYEIEYTTDPESGHRVLYINHDWYSSVYDNPNYKNVLRYADPQQLPFYEAEAAEIFEKQKEYQKIKRDASPRIKRRNKIILCSTLAVVLVAIGIWATLYLIIPYSKYYQAMDLMEQDEDGHAVARDILVELDPWDGFLPNLTPKIKKCTRTIHNTFHNHRCDVDDWTDIIAIDAGKTHTVGLRSDGTVVAVGDYENGQCDVDDWTNIVAIAAGGDFTVGLTADGYGRSTKEEFEWGWKPDLVAIEAGNDFLIGLNKDGSVIGTEEGYVGIPFFDWGWSDIKKICVSETSVFALKKDGTVLNYLSDWDEEQLKNWTDIVDISVSADDYCLLGLKLDGTVVTSLNPYYLEYYESINDWTNISAIAAGNKYFAVGLKKDGTLALTERSGYSNCFDDYDLSDQTEIVAICATARHFVALKSDGTVIAYGEEISSSCDWYCENYLNEVDFWDKNSLYVE